jgi:hypothetical protein
MAGKDRQIINMVLGIGGGRLSQGWLARVDWDTPGGKKLSENVEIEWRLSDEYETARRMGDAVPAAGFYLPAGAAAHGYGHWAGTPGVPYSPRAGGHGGGGSQHSQVGAYGPAPLDYSTPLVPSGSPDAACDVGDATRWEPDPDHRNGDGTDDLFAFYDDPYTHFPPRYVLDGWPPASCPVCGEGDPRFSDVINDAGYGTVFLCYACGNMVDETGTSV